MILNILGTEYTAQIMPRIDNSRLMESDIEGYTDFSTKKIRLVDHEYDTDDVSSQEDLYEVEAEVLRHEIVHAFLYESGLEDMSRDEKLVDWIALQLPKMNDVCNTACKELIDKRHDIAKKSGLIINRDTNTLENSVLQDILNPCKENIDLTADDKTLRTQFIKYQDLQTSAVDTEKVISLDSNVKHSSKKK